MWQWISAKNMELVKVSSYMIDIMQDLDTDISEDLPY
jgi:hypothetical protein